MRKDEVKREPATRDSVRSATNVLELYMYRIPCT